MSIVTLNDRAVRSVSAFGSLNTGSMIFIKKLTASSSSTISFVDGSSDVVLDSTYKEYLFTFKDIHPSATGVDGLTFQGSTDGGSNYNTTITSSYFRATHDEDGSNGALAYQESQDLAQSTNFQNIGQSVGVDNDQSLAGILQLFNPSSTTFVKHFIARTNNAHQSDKTRDVFTAGYFNTTSAIDAVQFKMSSGNIDAGDICLYGIN
tara:strand:- start:45 stop:665 length:621 start_codon:yes stop_codon:yes gene_type:complete